MVFVIRTAVICQGGYVEVDMPDLMPVLNPSLYMELLLFLTMRIMGAV